MLVMKLGLIIILNLILEGTILPHFTIMGHIPNISLVTIIILAFRRNKYYAGFFGLGTGLIYDILFGKTVGIKGLIFFLIGYYTGEIKSNLNSDNVFIPTLFSSIGTIIYNSMYFVFMFFLGENIDLSMVMNNILSIEILYNALLTFIIIKILDKIFVTPSLRFGNK